MWKKSQPDIRDRLHTPEENPQSFPDFKAGLEAETEVRSTLTQTDRKASQFESYQSLLWKLNPKDLVVEGGVNALRKAIQRGQSPVSSQSDLIATHSTSYRDAGSVRESGTLDDMPGEESFVDAQDSVDEEVSAGVEGLL
eukprot:Trichotokara_eunicae@DN3029_c0_g1_i1.p1